MPSMVPNSTFPPRPAGPVTAPRRGVTLGQRAAVCLAGGATLLVLWAGAATWLVATRDDLAQRVFVRETELQYRYEDRISALQNELERAVTQNLVERNGVTTRLEGVARRQADIENRQAWLGRLAERLPAEKSIDPMPGAERSAGGASLALTKPAPVSEPFALRLGDVPPAVEPPKQPARDRLSLIEGALDGIGVSEIRLVEDLRRTAQARLSRLRSAINATGFDADRMALPKAAGGPLVPLPPSARNTGAFGPLAAELEATFDELDRLTAVTRAIPLGRPLAGELEMTSPFGYRLDPFTRSAALHTGTDFRAESGSPVRATAGGKVTAAEYTGGYGNMVEIDHGGGFVTRYGHLSAFSVSPGERVNAGEIVGRVGSTGRSTGSHLHYETRINGEPVNPLRFLDAGTQLAGALGELH